MIPRKPSVLVVEDEQLIRDVIVAELVGAGFGVIEAECGETAAAILADGHEIDVVFTDIRLGGELNGWDIGERARARFPDVSVIYASGYSIRPPRQVEDSLYFSKPYKAADILAACRGLSPMRKSR